MKGGFIAFAARSVLSLLCMMGLLFSAWCGSAPASAEPQNTSDVLGPNLIYNGDFDNGIWYERFRGWSPSGWYQWFYGGGHVPEHAVGRDVPLAGKEYVRLHMWAHAWGGGILQTVEDVVPGRWYRVIGHGWYSPLSDKNPRARVGIEPYGSLTEQFSVDVSAHPAPPYEESIPNEPDALARVVWSPEKENEQWTQFVVAAEAKSDIVQVILYCNPDQRPDQIYEMNWDDISMYEIPWPMKRLVSEPRILTVADRVTDVAVNIDPGLDKATVTWNTTTPASAIQVIYRFMNAESFDPEKVDEMKSPPYLRTTEFPLESRVVYGEYGNSHSVEISDLSVPEWAVGMQIVSLTRILDEGEARTICSPVVSVAVPR